MAPKPGNTNALKHGLYAKHFTKEEKTALKKMPADDLTLEIAALRTVTDNILAKIRSATDTEEQTKLVGAFTTCVTAINTCARTHAILNGTYNPLDDAIQQALADIDPYYKKDDLK